MGRCSVRPCPTRRSVIFRFPTISGTLAEYGLHTNEAEEAPPRLLSRLADLWLMDMGFSQGVYLRRLNAETASGRGGRRCQLC
jgi:hypothetical protein